MVEVSSDADASKAAVELLRHRRPEMKCLCGHHQVNLSTKAGKRWGFGKRGKGSFNVTSAHSSTPQHQKLKKKGVPKRYPYPVCWQITQGS
ncbi:hypothetical protein LWI28_020598 [Acer negundo]|uniref:Uncharacterized protein n=1 Tax=Acer negundo TaxID=4023 RepID=A0AAD5IT14_ACENE|nr:hypothetical protein LWI28_020598 [Acer negundo]